MMGYNIEFYPYLPKIYIYFFLHFDFRSDPDLDPEYFSSRAGSGSGSVEKMSDPHPWLPHPPGDTVAPLSRLFSLEGETQQPWADIRFKL